MGAINFNMKYQFKKKVIVCITLMCITLLASAQKADTVLNKFYMSILTNLNYPQFLVDNCVPTVTMLKVEIDEKGLVKEIKMSDSADLLVRVQFTSIMDKLDTSSFQKYARLKFLKNISVLIPFTFFLATEHCRSPMFKVSFLDNLFYFNKELFRDTTCILPPLIFNGKRSSINKGMK